MIVFPDLTEAINFMIGIREGVAAYKRGEITPWAEVRKELGLAG